MSDKIDRLNTLRRKSKSQSNQEAIKDAVKRAKQHIRNFGVG